MKFRTQARRDRIVKTASEVFREVGFDGASMSEIAKRVGGSKATIYGYFKSKQELFLAFVHSEAKQRLLAAFEEFKHQSDKDLHVALVGFGASYVVFMCSETAAAADRAVLSQSGQYEIGKLFYETGPLVGHKLIASVLKDAMKSGQMRAADPLTAARHYVGLLTSEIQHRMYYQKIEPMLPKRARRIAERSVEVFLHGYDKRSGHSETDAPGLRAADD